MLCDVDQVTAMRFILRQPSPVWLHFTIEDLQIFPPGQKVSRCQSYPTARHGQGARTSHCPQLCTWHFPPQLWGAHTGLWVQVLVLCWGTWDPLVLQWCWGRDCSDNHSKHRIPYKILFKDSKVTFKSSITMGGL